MKINKNRKRKKKNLKTVGRVLLFLLEAALLVGAIKLGTTFFEQVDGKQRFIGIRSLKIENELKLEELTRFSRLESFDLCSIEISEQQRDALQRLYPDAEIIWNISINGTNYPSNSETLSFEDIPEDIDRVRLFEKLSELHIEHCPDPGAMLELSEKLSPLKVTWNVPMNGKWYQSDTESISFGVGEIDYDSFMNMAGYFSDLKTVVIAGEDLTAAQQVNMMEKYPNLEFRWSIVINGIGFDPNSETLHFDEGQIGFEDFMTMAAYFPNLKTVEIEGTDLTPQQQIAMLEEYPELDFRWKLVINGMGFAPDSETLHFDEGQISFEDFMTMADYFPKLKTVEIEGTDLTSQQQAAMLETYPGLDFQWKLVINGTGYDKDAETLHFQAGRMNYEEFVTMAGYFHNLKTVEVEGTELNSTQQIALLEKFPELEFKWKIVLDGIGYDPKLETLSFPGISPDIARLEEALFLFPNLKAIDLDDSLMPAGERARLRLRHPELDISWHVTLMGETYPCTETSFDFSGIQFESNAELMEVLPYLPDMKRIEMIDCGLSDDEMGELFDAFPNIKFVWIIYFGNYYLRTDAEYFIPSAWKNGIRLMDRDFTSIRYCTDLVGLDLGHTYIQDLYFLRYMPKLKYLILVDSSVFDISPISYCKELVFLECYMLRITDFSPLLECTKLTDINIGYTRADPNETIEVLKQMTQLKRLWYCSCPFSAAQVDSLKEALPNCEMYMPVGGESTGSTWRYDQSYYDMRDCFEMYYMPGGTIGVDYRGYQEIRDDYGKTFVLVDWDGRQRWWEQDEFKNWDYHIVGINC